MELSAQKQFEIFKHSFHLACLCQENRVVAINQPGANLLGQSPDALIGQNIADFVTEPYRDVLSDELPGLAETGEIIPAKLVSKCGQEYDVELKISAAPEIGEGFFIIVARDITQRTRVSEMMKRQEEQYRKLVNMALDLICLSEDGRITFINKAGAKLLKIKEGSTLVGQPFWELFHPDYEHIFKDGIKELVEEENVFPARLACRDGHYLDVEVAIIALDGLLANKIMIEARDITEHNAAVHELHEANKYLEKRVEERTKELMDEVAERRRAQSRLMHIASHDILTDLPNRGLLMDRISMALSRASQTEERFSLLFIDLDGFKEVNDTLGHEAGDSVLIEVANRLKAAANENDTVARTGGDEFVILVGDGDRRTDAEGLAQAIIASLSEPVSIKSGETARLGASIGISNFPEDGDNASTLLKKADDAMYEAKNSGKNTFRVSDPQAA